MAVGHHRVDQLQDAEHHRHRRHRGTDQALSRTSAKTTTCGSSCCAEPVRRRSSAAPTSTRWSTSTGPAARCSSADSRACARRFANAPCPSSPGSRAGASAVAWKSRCRCDLRIAESGAKFGMPEVAVGIPSVIHSALMPALIGASHSAWLLLTGETIDADDGCHLGPGARGRRRRRTRRPHRRARPRDSADSARTRSGNKSASSTSGST